MRNLITYEEISSLARPCSADREMAEAMIAEAQRVEIKPRLGDALYAAILEFNLVYCGGSADSSIDADTLIVSFPETYYIVGAEDSVISPPNRFDLLFNGGTWRDKSGNTHVLTGVKTALAYYALARIVRDGNIQASTYGSVIKDDQYSSDPEKVERQRQYRELFGQADGYMAEALSYLKKNSNMFPEYKACGEMRSNRTTFKIIGK